MFAWLLITCAAPDAADSAPPVHLPGHNDCLPEGEQMEAEVCLAVIEDQGRYPTVSENKSGDDPGVEDPRAADPELVWLTGEVKRCTCSCCHTRSWGGAGVYFWDLEWGPVWTDSASLWSLGVFSGTTDNYVQTLPIEDLDRVRAWYEGESDRRRAREAAEE